MSQLPSCTHPIWKQQETFIWPVACCTVVVSTAAVRVESSHSHMRHQTISEGQIILQGSISQSTNLTCAQYYIPNISALRNFCEPHQNQISAIIFSQSDVDSCIDTEYLWFRHPRRSCSTNQLSFIAIWNIRKCWLIHKIRENYVKWIFPRIRYVCGKCD